MARKYYDIVNFTKKYKGELHSFFLDLKAWRQFKTRYKLEWQKLRFGPESLPRIPKIRGLYAFTVELSPAKLPVHGYIMYVGITGGDSGATLHSRCYQYLRELKSHEGRPAVLFMMENWRDDLFFNFVPLPNHSVKLEKLERAFINSIIPPINKRDLEADISAAKAATF